MVPGSRGSGSGGFAVIRSLVALLDHTWVLYRGTSTSDSHALAGGNTGGDSRTSGRTQWRGKSGRIPGRLRLITFITRRGPGDTEEVRRQTGYRQVTRQPGN